MTKLGLLFALVVPWLKVIWAPHSASDSSSHIVNSLVTSHDLLSCVGKPPSELKTGYVAHVQPIFWRFSQVMLVGEHSVFVIQILILVA